MLVLELNIFRSQLFEFSVNTESNEKGDFLLHVACRSGICQLPLILSLVRLQNADIDLCNAEGMTPLMIVAGAGESVLCDVRTNEPCLKKTCLRSFQPGLTQTGLYSHRRCLEA